MSSKSRFLGWLTVTTMVLSSGLASSQRAKERPWLLGGPLSAKKREIRLDPRLPRGAWRHFAARPKSDGTRRICSFQRPVCVHGAPGIDDARLLRGLQAMERAYQRAILVLGLPAPLADAGRGGSNALDLYLAADFPELAVELEAQHFHSFDVASTFCRSGAVSQASLDRAATLCLGESVGRGLDAGATPHTQRAFATHLWWTTGKPTALDAEAVDNFQAHPERAPVSRELDASSEGAATWFDTLEALRGQRRGASLASSLLAVAASSTPPAALRWQNEPDTFDVLRSTFQYDTMRMAQLLNQWAVARAFVGSRGDGSHVPHLGWSGDFGRVRFDWRIKYSELPRRVAARRPIEPTGSIYVWLELDDVALGATLGFQAEWEAPVSFVWSLVQVDRQGREMRRLEVPFKERATSTEQRLSSFEGASYVLVVGTNMGGVDADHPFDPDVAPYEPHLCTVYLVQL